jgi:hypothetical protein
MLRRVHAAVRRAWVALGVVPAAILVVACAATMVMYCANDNFDDNPSALRGDGRYRPVLARGDGHMHFLITRSIVFDRDLDFDNDLARFGDPWNQPRTVTGRKNVMQQIGPSVIWAPLLAAAHGVALTANVFGADIETHGYTMFHQRILFASSVAFAWLAVALGALVAYRLAGGRWAVAWAAAAILLGTSLTYYATFMPGYAHAMDAGACAAFLALWALTLGELRWRRYVGLGLLLGIAGMVRVQDLGFGVVLLLELGALAGQRLRGAPGGRATELALLLARGALVLALAVLLFVPQLYVWHLFYDAWLTTPQGPGQMRYAHPMVLEQLFSSRNGWFSNHPIAYLGAIGLVVGVIAGPRLGPRVRLVCAALLASSAVQVYVNAASFDWWSMASFGQRRMCSSSFSVLVGLAVLLRWAGARLGGRVPARAQLALAALALGYLIAWNLAWVGQLAHGRPAGRDNRPTCCADVPPALAWIARPVYAAVGNPFELPASAYFALRHGVELQRWDATVGNYALVPALAGYIDGSYRAATATWNALDERYVLGGLGPVQRGGGRSWRWTIAPEARLLLPQHLPEPHRITVPIAANVPAGERARVTISCNGRRVAEEQVGGAWTTISFDTDGRVGESVIAIAAELAPPRAGEAGTDAAAAPAAPPGGGPVGVAIGPFGVRLP